MTSLNSRRSTTSRLDQESTAGDSGYSSPFSKLSSTRGSARPFHSFGIVSGVGGGDETRVGSGGGGGQEGTVVHISTATEREVDFGGEDLKVDGVSFCPL